MRDANDMGYECLLLSDCTGATDHNNHLAALDMVKKQARACAARWKWVPLQGDACPRRPTASTMMSTTQMTPTGSSLGRCSRLTLPLPTVTTSCP